jgi:transcriptional regulator CtsR
MIDGMKNDEGSIKIDLRTNLVKKSPIDKIMREVLSGTEKDVIIQLYIDEETFTDEEEMDLLTSVLTESAFHSKDDGARLRMQIVNEDTNEVVPVDNPYQTTEKK